MSPVRPPATSKGGRELGNDGNGGFGLAEYEDLDDLNRMVSLLKERLTRTTEIRLRTTDGTSILLGVEVREIVVDDEELLLLILSDEAP